MSEPTTSLKATVADESEEIAAEASSSVKPETGAEAEESKEEVKEEKVDPNALPEDACVTLYLQNLNEKVKIPGQSPSYTVFSLGRMPPL
jgi:U2 small nuclear ribonucleoprotein B''